ncbi:MAG TPA: hypothetical protein VNN07_03730 [Candidatus Tectomicrobia bacterium]|nr:hypothetical protein [Candidatus Tectomicrobia bacterium]
MASRLWEWPRVPEDEPSNAWYAGRAERHEKGPRRFEVLQRRLAVALGRHPDDPDVIRALAEVAIGITIKIGPTPVHADR